MTQCLELEHISRDTCRRLEKAVNPLEWVTLVTQEKMIKYWYKVSGRTQYKYNCQKILCTELRNCAGRWFFCDCNCLSFFKKSYVVRYRSQSIWTTHELFYFYNKGYICFFVCLTNSMSVWYFTKYEICSSYRYRVVFTTQSKIHESFFAKIAVFSG